MWLLPNFTSYVFKDVAFKEKCPVPQIEESQKLEVARQVAVSKKRWVESLQEKSWGCWRGKEGSVGNVRRCISRERRDDVIKSTILTILYYASQGHNRGQKNDFGCGWRRIWLPIWIQRAGWRREIKIDWWNTNGNGMGKLVKLSSLQRDRNRDSSSLAASRRRWISCTVPSTYTPEHRSVLLFASAL